MAANISIVDTVTTAPAIQNRSRIAESAAFLEALVTLDLPKLHAVDFINCHPDDDFVPDLGPYALLSLPSVRVFTYQLCSCFEDNDADEKIQAELSRNGICVKTICDQELDNVGFHTLPFR